MGQAWHSEGAHLASGPLPHNAGVTKPLSGEYDDFDSGSMICRADCRRTRAEPRATKLPNESGPRIQEAGATDTRRPSGMHVSVD